jgi:hypothetical protein
MAVGVFFVQIIAFLDGLVVELDLTLTGRFGGVTKEPTQIALSYPGILKTLTNVQPFSERKSSWLVPVWAA